MGVAALTGVESRGMALEINSQGYRGPELDPDHRLPRILAIGDSCTFGLAGFPSYPQVMGEWLAEGGSPVEVVNGGVEGYSVRNAFLEWPRHHRLDPQLVVLYLGWNSLFDLGPDNPREAQWALPSLLLKSWRLLADPRDPGDTRKARALLERPKRVDPLEPAVQEIDDREEPRYMGVLTHLVELWRQARVPVALITLPGLFTVEAPPPRHEAWPWATCRSSPPTPRCWPA